MVRLGEIILIHDLKRQGLSITAIARQVGLDRKTVRRYLQGGLEPPAYKRRDPAPRRIEAFEAYLRERVAAYPELSGKRLLREIRELGYVGGYTAVTDFAAEGAAAAAAAVRTAVRNAARPPGHSRWIWGRFCAGQDLQTVLRCHIDAFAAMGGAPSELLYDRMKAVVLGEGPDGVVSYNISLVALLNHYGAIPRACRPYRAKTKGKVERPYRCVRQDFFLARRFRNLDDLNAQFDHWRTEIATRACTPPPAASSPSTSPRRDRR